jgi:hypothetical protein
VLVVEATTAEGAHTTTRPPLQNYARYGGPGNTHVVHDDPNGPWFSLVSETSGLVVWGSHNLSGMGLQVGRSLRHQNLLLSLEVG